METKVETRQTIADLRTYTAEIVDQFPDHLDVSADEAGERLKSLVIEYRAPVDEARRSAVSSYPNEAGIECDEFAGGSGGNEQTLLNDIDEDEQWVDVRAKIVELWEPRSESITQVGLLGDDSGRMKLVSFTTSEPPELEEGKSYALGNVVTDEYQGDFSTGLNRAMSITELDGEIEVGDDSTSAEGALVGSQSENGLIKRCPEEGYTHVLQNGRCSEHGSVEGEFDLRIKAVVDDSDEVHEVIFNREIMEGLTDIELNEAKQMTVDTLNTIIVEEEMRGDLIGYYYCVTGPTLGRYVLANEVEQPREPAGAEELLIKARPM